MGIGTFKHIKTLLKLIMKVKHNILFAAIVLLITSCITTENAMNNYQTIMVESTENETDMIIPFSFYAKKETPVFSNSVLSIKINNFSIDGKSILGVPLEIDFDDFDMSKKMIKQNIMFTYLLRNHEQNKKYWKFIVVSQLQDDDFSFTEYMVSKKFTKIMITYQIRFADNLLSTKNTIKIEHKL